MGFDPATQRRPSFSSSPSSSPTSTFLIKAMLEAIEKTLWIALIYHNQGIQNILTGVSKNRGKPPKSSILIGFFIINHPFWGTNYFWKHPYTINSIGYKSGKQLPVKCRVDYYFGGYRSTYGHSWYHLFFNNPY